MLHLIKSFRTKKFELVMVSKNGKVLLSSHQGYERKAGCYKAVRSMMGMLKIPHLPCYIQDDTFDDPKVFEVYPTKVIDSFFMKPEKKYIPK